MGNSNTTLNKEITNNTTVKETTQLPTRLPARLHNKLDCKLTCILCNKTLSYLKTEHNCDIRPHFSEFTIKYRK